MSIRKRGRAQYLVRCRGSRPTRCRRGKPQSSSSCTTSCQRALGEQYEDAETTLGEEIDSYIGWKKRPETCGPAPSSTSTARGLLEADRDKRCSQLRRAELEDAIVERARKHPRSRRTSYELLKAVLRRAHERGQRIDGRILRIPAIPHTAREGIALTAEELRELASWLPERHKRLVLLAGTVGARQNEWFTLDERSLELDGNEPVMRVPRIHNKSRRPRRSRSPREALLLKEQLLARTAGTSPCSRTTKAPSGTGIASATKCGKTPSRQRATTRFRSTCSGTPRSRSCAGAGIGPSGSPNVSATRMAARSC